jgi:putative heme-binding domain-containing protein
VEVVSRSPSVEVRRNAVWALTRIEGARAREAVRTALGDRDDEVRRAAIHSAGLWRDGAALTPLVAALKSGRPALQRSAAEALGRIGDARAVPELLRASASAGDRVLEHSLTYALIEIGDASSTGAGLQSAASGSRRAALIALDQIDGGRLQPAQITPLLTSSDGVIKQTAWWIAERHPEWGSALVEFFERRLTTADLGTAERDALARQLTPFAGAAAIQDLLARTVAGGTSTGARLAALGAMSGAASSAVPAATRVKELPVPWADALARAMTSTDDAVTRQAISVARAIPAGKAGSAALADALLRLARDPGRPPEVRVDALSARPAGASLDTDLFALLRTSLEPARPAPLRTAAAAVLQRAALDRDQLLALAASLETAGPLELVRLLPAFEKSTDEEVGLAMIAALDRSQARTTVRADTLRATLAKYPPPVQRAGEVLLTSVNLDATKQAARLDELMKAAQNGDVARGQTVFNSAKAACLSCHAIGYIGGRVGPDLTRVGQVRSERDLLEAVVFPNASFARGFEAVTVRTRTGATHGGILRSDAPDEVVLGTVAGPDVRIPRPDIAEIEPGTVSLMPPGYGELLSRQELADLLAFLKAAR